VPRIEYCAVLLKLGLFAVGFRERLHQKARFGFGFLAVCALRTQPLDQGLQKGRQENAEVRRLPLGDAKHARHYCLDDPVEALLEKKFKN